MSGVLIIGAGGHGKVVADILARSGVHVSGFLDDNPASWGGSRLGVPVLGPVKDLARYEPVGVILAVGDNRVRCELAEHLAPEVKARWINAIHPASVISPSVKLGCGIVVAAGAVVNPDTVLSDHSIVNTGATVDHDCRVGAFSHIAPGAHLAGAVSVGKGVLVGISAAVIPGRSLGDWATIGAGAVVVRDVPEGAVARGVPASW